MKTYILAPGSYGERVADETSITKDDRIYTSEEGAALSIDGNSLIAEKVAHDQDGALGIIPVHNLYGRVVGKAVAAIMQQGNAVTIVGDHLLPISHVLAMTTGGISPEIIRSHEQALIQCGDALRERYGGAKLIRDNATSACIGKLGKSDAVICARETAINRGLTIIDDTINPSNNETLFVLIATTSKLHILLPQIQTTENKTSLVSITLPDKPGSLLEVLNRLNHGTNGGDADLRGFSQIESHVKIGGALHDIHLIYRDLDESKIRNRKGIQLVPKLGVPRT